MTRQIVKPELLAPAGNMEKCKMALFYGADAVYLGGKMFGLRAFANNFEIDEIKEACDFAHSLGKKVYVTVNIFAHNSDIEKLPAYLLALQNAGADALLISDLGVWQTARCPQNAAACKHAGQYYKLGKRAGMAGFGRGARSVGARTFS